MSQDHKRITDGREPGGPDGSALLSSFFAERALPPRNVHGGHRARLRVNAGRDRSLAGFSDIELVELLLSFFVPRRDTNPLAHRLLAEFGTLKGVLDAPKEELARFSPLSADAARAIGLLRDAARLNGACAAEYPQKEVLTKLFLYVVKSSKRSESLVVYMDERARIMAVERHKGIVPPPRSVLGGAIRRKARFVTIYGADGTLFPDAFGASRTVRRLNNALSAAGITLVDCIMLTEGGYYTIGKPEIFGTVIFTFEPHDLGITDLKLLDLVRSLD